MPGNESTAKVLGYAGLIPFVVFSIGAWVPLPYVDNAVPILVAYAAVILSFMGAVHWGVALSSPSRDRSKYYIASVVPALTAWLALLMPETGLLAAAIACERLRAAVEKLPPRGTGAITASVGIAECEGRAAVYEGLYEAADRCLYTAKRGGRNRVATRSAPVAEAAS